MMHDLEQHNATCSLIRRLGEIRMSESERRAALEYMRRGERVAACILALARLLRGAYAVLSRTRMARQRTAPPQRETLVRR